MLKNDDVSHAAINQTTYLTNSHLIKQCLSPVLVTRLKILAAFCPFPDPRDPAFFYKTPSTLPRRFMFGNLIF